MNTHELKEETPTTTVVTTAYHCVRVSPTGEARSTIRDADGLRLWLRANRTFRPMNALFVDGRPASLNDYGSFTAEQVARIQFSLEAETVLVDKSKIDLEPFERPCTSLAYEVAGSQVVH